MMTPSPDNLNVTEATEADLSAVAVLIREELRRRAEEHPDPFRSIKGQEHVKRAFTVAALGGHSLALFGPPGAGKTMFARAAAGFGFPVLEAHPCPCGYLSDPRRSCSCTAKAIQAHRSTAAWDRLKLCDIHIEVPPVPATEMLSRGRTTTTAHIRDDLKRAGPRPDPDAPLSDTCRTLLKQAVTELGFEARTVRTVLSVAATIAGLAHHSEIGTDDLCEAIQYRRLDRCGL